MKALPLVIALLLFWATSAAAGLTIAQLEGAWWSDPANPTADFAIHGGQVWLDHDSGYHPCYLEGDVLVFELGLISARSGSGSSAWRETGWSWKIRITGGPCC